MKLTETVYARLNSAQLKFDRYNLQDGRQVQRYFVHADRPLIKALLESNPDRNRKLDPAQVAKLKRAALSGSWTPEVGDLLLQRLPNSELALSGGQHRLTALDQAFDASPLFKGVEMYVTITSSPAAAINANEGKRGTLADHLAMSSESEFSRDEAPAAQAVIRVVTGRMFGANGVNAVDAALEIDLANMIDEESKAADAFVRARTPTRNYLLTTHVLMSLVGARSQAETYIRGLLQRGDIRANSPGQFVSSILNNTRSTRSVNLHKSADRLGIILLGAFKALDADEQMTRVVLPDDTTVFTHAVTLWRRKLSVAKDGAVFYGAVQEAVSQCRTTKQKATAESKRRTRTTPRVGVDERAVAH